MPVPIENSASASMYSVLVAAEVDLGVDRQLRGQHRAEEPEPGDAEHRVAHRALPAGIARIVRRFR